MALERFVRRISRFFNHEIKNRHSRNRYIVLIPYLTKETGKTFDSPVSMTADGLFYHLAREGKISGLELPRGVKFNDERVLMGEEMVDEYCEYLETQMTPAQKKRLSWALEAIKLRRQNLKKVSPSD